MNRSRATILVALILSIGIPLPSASAHDDLVTATPAKGDQLATLPAQVTLEFGENLLALGEAKTNVLIVRDANGVQIDKSDSKVSGRFLTVSLNSTDYGGTFTVSWRVVSGDGHPVEGSYQFSTPTSVAISPVVTIAPKPNTTLEVKKEKEVSFWNRYESRILLGFTLLIALLIWMRFKFLEKGERGDIGTP